MTFVILFPVLKDQKHYYQLTQFSFSCSKTEKKLSSIDDVPKSSEFQLYISMKNIKI